MDNSNKKTGLYIHIPFCVKKCNYCAFISFPADESPRAEYTDALINEIRMRSAGKEKIKLDTVYIGGGTPSVLDVSQLSRVIKAVRQYYDVAPEAEITLEANPGTLGKKDVVTRTKLIAYRSMGINRLSMGVQSMDNDRLQQMMRIEKFLVYFITSLRGNEVVLVRLKKHLRHLPFDEDLLDDVEVELQQAYTTANIYSEVLERQRSSYSSIISNNLNAIMKRLTTITIILMIPAAISGFFGMNVPNGMEHWWPAFICIVVFTLVLIIISYVIFKRKNLF